MKFVVIPRTSINEVALHESLLAQIGADYIGLSRTPEEVLIYLKPEADSAAVLLAQTIASDHDPRILSESQVAALVREEDLQALANKYPNALETNLYAMESANIRELAERLKRLELLIGEGHAR